MAEPFVVKLERQKYPGYGRCIYCGSDGGKDKLRREHILPRSLGGNAEILDASCTVCEGKTSHIDGALANSVFKELRIYEGIQSRRKTTTKTTHLPMTFELPTGERVTKDLLVRNRPLTVFLPLLYQPAILTGIDRADKFSIQTMHSITHIPEGFQPLALAATAFKIVLDARLDLTTLARALAKIGYCFTVLRYGLDRFDPLDLPALIRGEYDDPFRYVGGTEMPLPAPQPGARHHISLFEVETGTRRYVGAEVRLFAPFGGDGNGRVGLPVYRVVTGALT